MLLIILIFKVMITLIKTTVIFAGESGSLHAS